MVSIDRSNTNSLWTTVMVEVLAHCGLTHVVISPGSRSTPLTIAFARHPKVKAIPVLDERSAGFFALGIAKQTHRPVALVCTSGTAAVNYFPAVVEASESRTPLLVLTADRPPELRDCGAGQTIDQIQLYGNFPIFQEEMMIPRCELDSLSSLRRTLNHAYNEALLGPVHLNCPFRDPLPPLQDGSTENAPVLDESFLEDISVREPKVKEPGGSITLSATRGIIIGGTSMPEEPEHYCESVARLSKASGWPVLADGLSPLRNYAGLQDRLVTSYDLLIRNTVLRESLRPNCVIALGPLPTSKELRKWLTETGADMYHVNRTGKNLDPTGTAVEVLEIAVAELQDCFSFKKGIDEAFSSLWMRAQRKATSTIDEHFKDPAAHGFEGKVGWMLANALPSSTPLFVASSMPVRDVEYFWPANDNKVRVFSSRGANGIDGTLSTALGIAYENQSSVLLTGDLAFLHDSNGLLIRPKFSGHLTVILINNQGGGIFNHLPVSQFEPPFEEFFATPQSVDFKQLVESMGCEYLKLNELEKLPSLVRSLPDSGIRIIEIETDRHRDSEYRKQLFKTISQSLA